MSFFLRLLLSVVSPSHARCLADDSGFVIERFCASALLAAFFQDFRSVSNSLFER